MQYHFMYKLGKGKIENDHYLLGCGSFLARLWMSLARSHSSQVWPGCKDNRDTGLRASSSKDRVSVPLVY